MLLRSTISNATEDNPALDHARLFALGMNHIRRLCRRLWTDHNTHDTGVAALEYVCYVLTDAAYRAGFPIEDLLAVSDDDARNMAAQFFTARRVLPSNPLTELDLRKLLLDIPGVTNAWIVPEPKRFFLDPAARRLTAEDPNLPGIRAVDVRGLYRARVALADNVAIEDREGLLAEAIAALRRNRNLCEDFVAVEPVVDQMFAVCAELDLAPGADPVDIDARLRFEVGEFLAPRVRRRTLEEMVGLKDDDGNPLAVDRIFNGPAPDHGFVTDEDLLAADLRTEIRLSDVFAVAAGVPGVRLVRDIVVNGLLTEGNRPAGRDAPSLKPVEPADKWRVPVEPGRRPRVSRLKSRIVQYKNGIPIQADRTEADARLDALLTAASEADGARSTAEADFPIPLGRPRSIASYHSLQNHFPLIYGLSTEGPSPDADKARRAAILQLKGYLLFFDQPLANFCARLAGARSLFSHDADPAPARVSQVVTTFVDYGKIYPDAAGDAEIADDIAAIFETPEEASARRDRFLDHLLARVASNFREYVDLTRTLFGMEVDRSIRLKSKFLREFPEQAARRGQARDETVGPWDSRNVTGLERRLERLLDIERPRTRIEQRDDGTFGFVVEPADGGDPILVAATTRATKRVARLDLSTAIEAAQNDAGYQRTETDEGLFDFVVMGDGGEPIARPPFPFATADDREAAVGRAIAMARAIAEGESILLVENLFLLPPDEMTGPFLPVCADPNCVACADDDPYSYRIHVVLPAEAGRFKNMDFRRFVEETVRAETPAHLVPKICWADAARFKAFEAALLQWRIVSVDAEIDERTAALADLLERISELKNVYPTQKLIDCGGGAESPFILGRTALGGESRSQ